MRSPPPSELFISSSPVQSTINDPDGRVETLYRAALGVERLNTHLSTFVNSNKGTFLDVFGRHVRLLASRPQSLARAQVTIYDKVLLLLTKSGQNLDNPAAIAWYCANHLGYQGRTTDNKNTKPVEQALDVSSAIFRVVTPPLNSPPTKEPTSAKRSDRSLLPAEMDVDSAGKRDPRFLNFWTVYSKARADYNAVADKRDTATLDAAKFLRDTAENGIHFLENKRIDKAVLTELKNTYDMAKEVVVQLNGGRKRKFDRAPQHGATHRGSTALLPHTVTHDRLNATRRREQKSMPKKREPRGRGPSGIPFGYTRAVDSYYPR